mmetsp:Transcript_23816/g.42164  ORF Transcript_23816/g.42164 Transcript_23816/m.42164 type:complete len:169 (-) Transcript_23816:1970-2476(-)
MRKVFLPCQVKVHLLYRERVFLLRFLVSPYHLCLEQMLRLSQVMGHLQCLEVPLFLLLYLGMLLHHCPVKVSHLFLEAQCLLCLVKDRHLFLAKACLLYLVKDLLLFQGKKLLLYLVKALLLCQDNQCHLYQAKAPLLFQGMLHLSQVRQCQLQVLQQAFLQSKSELL